MHTQSNFGRTGGSEMFRKAEKGEVPTLWGLYVWRHFPRQQQVFQRYDQTRGLPGSQLKQPVFLFSFSFFNITTDITHFYFLYSCFYFFHLPLVFFPLLFIFLYFICILTFLFYLLLFTFVFCFVYIIQANKIIELPYLKYRCFKQLRFTKHWQNILK